MKTKNNDRIENEVDFIDAPAYNNSLKTLMEAYPDGVPDTVICKVMHMTTETLDMTYKKAIKKLKTAMGE
jgi:hypothetical protein